MWPIMWELVGKGEDACSGRQIGLVGRAAWIHYIEGDEAHEYTHGVLRGIPCLDQSRACSAANRIRVRSPLSHVARTSTAAGGMPPVSPQGSLVPLKRAASVMLIEQV
jgi:hypothetical protein